MLAKKLCSNHRTCMALAKLQPSHRSKPQRSLASPLEVFYNSIISRPSGPQARLGRPVELSVPGAHGTWVP